MSVVLLCVMLAGNGAAIKAQNTIQTAEHRGKYEKLLALLKSAKSQADHKSWDLAIGLATEALDYTYNEESKLWVYGQRATFYAGKREYQNAINDYGECIRLAEHKSFYYASRAYTYLLMKRPGEAIADYSEIIRLKPESAVDYTTRARVYYSIKAYAEAIADFTQAIRFGGDAFNYHQRGLAFRELKEYENALKDFSYLIEANPKSPKYLAELYYERGRTYFLLGNYDEAFRDANTSLNFNPLIEGGEKLKRDAAQKGGEKAPSKTP